MRKTLQTSLIVLRHPDLFHSSASDLGWLSVSHLNMVVFFSEIKTGCLAEVKRNGFSDSEYLMKRYETLPILKGDVTHKLCWYPAEGFLLSTHPWKHSISSMCQFIAGEGATHCQVCSDIRLRFKPLAEDGSFSWMSVFFFYSQYASRQKAYYVQEHVWEIVRLLGNCSPLGNLKKIVEKRRIA